MPATLKKIDLDDVKNIVGRALLDAQFRRRLLEDAKGTLIILGYDHSEESLAFFENLISDTFKDVAKEIEDRLGGRPVVALWL